MTKPFKCPLLRKEQTFLKDHFNKGNHPTDYCGLGSDLEEAKNPVMTTEWNMRQAARLGLQHKGNKFVQKVVHFSQSTGRFQSHSTHAKNLLQA